MADSDASTRMTSAPASAGEIGRSFKSAWTDPPPPTDDDPLLGMTLSRTYRITGILGEGGMGRVYEAWHTRIKQKRYAIKVLHPEYARSPEVLSRFQREAEAAASVSHPNAVGVYDVALTPQGWPYLVCDFLEGVDFSEHLKDHAPLRPSTAKHIALQVCDALIEAHACGVVHRDLKPQNVFLVGDFKDGVPEFPVAKVLDFGLSRFLGSGDSELTKTGVIMGTPSYMAPEQARGERVDHRCDVYGVGAIVYASLTGRPPFKTETPQATVLAVMNEEPPRPTALNPDIPVALELVIQKAMAKDPEQRYQTMQDLQSAIAELSLGTQAMGADNDPLGAAQTRMLAPTSAEDHNLAVKSARLNFVLYGLLATTLCFTAIATAIAGAITLIAGHWPLTRMETVLTLLIIIGTLLTPTLLLVRRLRKTVWSNTARVVSMLKTIRAAATTGMFAYGTCALIWLFIDDVAVHFVDLPGIAGGGLHWPGTSIVLLGAAVMAAATVWLRTTLRTPGAWVDAASGAKRRFRRFITGPVLTTVGVAWTLAALVLGTAWRHHDRTRSAPVTTLRVPVPSTETPSPSPAKEEVAEATDDGDAPTEQPADEAPTETAELAPKESLQAAMAQGLDALLPLLEKYPRDPEVLRAVAYSQASRASGMNDSLKTLERLFALAPQIVNDADLQRMVMQMTRSRGASSGAFDLLGNHMGAVGADILYKLALTRPKQKDQALKTLAKPKVREHFSPALQIAYDLRYEKSCKARLPLLPRAKQMGDERAVRVLKLLATPLSKCAKKPCKPTCPQEATTFLATAEAIGKRLQLSQ